MESSLSSPVKATRLSCIDELSRCSDIDQKIIQILIAIENVPSTITDYREKERYLEELLKIIRNGQQKHGERELIIVFRHLLGSLYINFEKFWGPTLRVVHTLVNETKFQDSLLLILLNHLKETNDILYNLDRSCDYSNDRPDHALHRNFIFQILARFGAFIQKHSKLFMDELFVFIKNEMLVSPFVEKYSTDNLFDYGKIEAAGSEQIVDGNNKQDHVVTRNKCRKVKHKFSTSANQMLKRKTRETFITAVKVIQSFKSMHHVHRADELKEFIMELLCCRDNGIQKASFNCLIIYDLESLKPYTNKIMRILEDKSIKSELASFSLDPESNENIVEEYRAELMPILMRILFGKMKNQIGKKSSGRDKAEHRKTLVMRFVSGCYTQEIMLFFEILFDPIFKFTKSSYIELEKILDSNLIFTNYTPLNRLHAMMATLSTYMKSVAHMKDESLQCVFKIINIIIYHVRKPLEDQLTLKSMTVKSVESLKVLRRECFNIILQFFMNFEYYGFQQHEINFTFKHLIWPGCDGFIDRNYSAPTPMLRLIQGFGENPVYHQLLIKREAGNKNHFLLNDLVSLYLSEKTTRPMLKHIASIIRTILISEDMEEDESMQLDAPSAVYIEPDASIPDYDRDYYNISSTIPFNHEIMLHFLPSIMEKLKSSCLQFLNEKDSRYMLDKDELKILSCMSSYVKDPNQCLLAARLLLSALDNIKKNDLILDTLKTCQTLICQAAPETDRSVISPIANTLSFQRNVDQREAICNLLVVISESDPHLLKCIKCIVLLNSTTGNIDTPDLVKMNEGFTLAFELLDGLDEDTMNQPELIKYILELLIHQVAFIMNNVDKYEFSIRENCSIFYDKMAPKLTHINLEEHAEMTKYILNDTILEKFIKKGLRETNDVIKYSYIGALRSLAINCHEMNNTLKELYWFCSPCAETDFWLNLKHIQVHQQSRAMARLLANKQLSTLSAKTLSAYFLPIASGFLFSKKYKSMASLVDNSIKLVGIVCRSLNWTIYESTLNYYLGMLTKANAAYQKQNIKLITTILKNFNFDLTNCPEAMKHQEEDEKLGRRMRKRRGPLAGNDESTEAIFAKVPKGKRLKPSTARMVYNSVTKKILPNLNNCLHEMTRVEFEHDKQMSDYVPEKQEIKRIPIAYAIVQLLNLLPGRYVLFRENFPTLFLKLASFLKSKNESIRKTARDTMTRILCFVGPTYVPDLLRVLRQNLDKGFQIHVLNFTIHSVLIKLNLDEYGCLDHSAHELVDLCLQEIFGTIAEDKEIAQILAKTPEAKKTKGYDTLMILSSCISADKLDELMATMKNYLKTSNDPKKVNKLSVCLQRIFSGLSKNEHFPLDKMLDFIKLQIDESIPSLRIRQKVEQANTSGPNGSVVTVNRLTSVASNSKPIREDRFLITKDPQRSRVVSKINERGNFHMVLDNSLRLLLITFEKNKEKLQNDDPEIMIRLETFVKILCVCLKASSPKCIMRSLKCIYFIAKVKTDLNSFKSKCNTIVKRIFIILNLYNGIGMTQGDNFEMIGMCFKTLTLLLLRCEHVQLNELQVKALLSYIEQNLHDNSRQATAFKSLHSILRRKIDSSEIKEIMLKVSELLITSDDETIQSLSIKMWSIYLLEFNHEPSVLKSYLTKFLRQLDYEFGDGRKSILRMLKVIIVKFPENILTNHYELMFHLLAQRVVNEENKDLRRQVGKLIVTLIQRLPSQQNYICNQFILQWASDNVKEIKVLGMKLTSIFLESVTILDHDKVAKILNLITDALIKNSVASEGTQYLLVSNKPRPNSGNEENNAEYGHDMNEDGRVVDSVRPKTILVNLQDKLLYHSLRLFKRLIMKGMCSLTEARHIENLKTIWLKIATETLTHCHLPVVLTSCELYLIFLRGVDLVSGLNQAITSTIQSTGVTTDENATVDPYLLRNAKIISRILCDKFIILLDRVNESERLLGYISEALIVLGQSIARSDASIKFELQYESSFDKVKVLDCFAKMKPEENLPDTGFLRDHLPYTITEARKKLDLYWLSTKIIMQARKEVALYRLKTSYRRELVLKWTAAILQQLGSKRATSYLILYSMTPVRELTDKGKNKNVDKRSPIIALSEDLLKFIKTLIGPDHFNQIYTKLQLHYTKKRVTRKKADAIMKVKDQIRGVKRKLKARRNKPKKRFSKMSS